MTTLNDLYQRAVASLAPGRRSGAVQHLLPSGSTLFCCIDRVAGRSITKAHMRTTYLLLSVGEKYSKPISRETAASLLKTEQAPQ